MEDKTLELIDAAKEAVAKLSYDHDARILAAVLLSRASWMYRQLRMAGLESKDTVDVLFAMSRDDAQTDDERAPLMVDGGVVTSGRKQ